MVARSIPVGVGRLCAADTVSTGDIAPARPAGAALEVISGPLYEEALTVVEGPRAFG